MAAKQTAGILVYRIRDNVLQVLLAHAGGPFWARKDDGAWSIFKGEPDPDEDLLAAAKREFEEETGQTFPENTAILELSAAKLGSGKTAYIWAIGQDYDPAAITSNTFQMEWPPHSGNKQDFPENDRAAWFDAADARAKLFSGQFVFIERLLNELQVDNPQLTTKSEKPRQPSLF